MNTTRCLKCDRALIEEEVQAHECKEEVLDYKIKGNTLWVFNGVGWFPVMPINRFLTSRRSTADYTEPALGFCQL